MDWDKLRIFHSVAEAGSFTHAGEQLNLSQSAVSRQISALEDSLKVPLFHRHARGLILTEQGELLYRTAHDVFGKLSMVEAQLAESKDRPKGPLKITTTVAFGTIWLAPRLSEFMDLYPEIEVELILSDKELDLGMREADVAVRLQPPRQAELIQRHLLTAQIHVYGSPQYLKKYGTPQSAEDLDDHRLLAYGSATKPPLPDLDWILHEGRDSKNPRKPALKINNLYGMMKALEGNAGLGALPDFMHQGETAGLVQVLPDLEGPQFDAYFVYAEEMRSSNRISVFRDFLLRKVAESKF
ncbi:LysR family transcriptional regulator [Kiloniella sp. b19]|uniref:LysR family transcriptional regulator n=1 Tax=Kiloniella sp. GXU_MW_B19 TaxID=3141326 RepID=UPI0031D9DEDC